MEKAVFQPNATAGYSGGVRVGNLYFIAGQGGADVTPPVGMSMIEAQTRRIFSKIEALLGEVGGTLENVCTMTAFITDNSLRREFQTLRAEIFQKDFPPSALIGVSSLGPDMLVEVQAIAVLD